MGDELAATGNLGIRGYFGLFAEYFFEYVKMRVSHRGDFLIGILTSMAATIFALGFVFVLFSKVPHLAGWRFEEVLFLYGFSLMPYGLFNVLGVNLYEFGNEYIMEGTFDRVLIRPVASLFQVMFQNFRIESFQEVLTGLAVVIYASVKMHVAWNLLDVLLLIFFSICGGTIYIFHFFLLFPVSFLFHDRLGGPPPGWNFFAVRRYPPFLFTAPL